MDNHNFNREEWIQHYAGRIFDNLQKWQTPLGMDENYVEKIAEYLADFYNDPLKKALIEETY